MSCAKKWAGLEIKDKKKSGCGANVGISGSIWENKIKITGKKCITHPKISNFSQFRVQTEDVEKFPSNEDLI